MCHHNLHGTQKISPFVTSWFLQRIIVSNNISKAFKMSSIGSPSFSPTLSLFKGYFKNSSRESSQWFNNKIILNSTTVIWISWKEHIWAFFQDDCLDLTTKYVYQISLQMTLLVWVSEIVYQSRAYTSVISLFVVV